MTFNTSDQLFECSTLWIIGIYRSVLSMVRCAQPEKTYSRTKIGYTRWSKYTWYHTYFYKIYTI